jgi:hypothetical protein
VLPVLKMSNSLSLTLSLALASDFNYDKISDPTNWGATHDESRGIIYDHNNFMIHATGTYIQPFIKS